MIARLKNVPVELRWGVPLAVVAYLLPYYLDELELFTASRILIFALFATSLNLLLGQTGLVSFAHAAYFGLGAYTVALVALHTDINPLLALVAAPFVAGAIAYVTGRFALRATELYFALLTLALSQLIYVVVFQWYGFTRGDNGIHGIAMPTFLDDVVNAYWFVAAAVLLGLGVLSLIFRSPFGAALTAIRENRRRASFIGIDVRRHEALAFTLAGAFAGLAGALFAIFNREAYPHLLYWTANATPIFIVLIGGMHRFLGPLVGAIVYVQLDEQITRDSRYANLVLGAILLVIVLAAPGGLIELGERLWTKVRGRRPRLAPEGAAAKAEGRA
jgi:branched-chain amino acid transport system permease protein